LLLKVFDKAEARSPVGIETNPIPIKTIKNVKILPPIVMG